MGVGGQPGRHILAVIGIQRRLHYLLYLSYLSYLSCLLRCNILGFQLLCFNSH
ncbi:hypothetical protein D1872_326360 [compost metagenome]